MLRRQKPLPTDAMNSLTVTRSIVRRSIGTPKPARVLYGDRFCFEIQAARAGACTGLLSRFRIPVRLCLGYRWGTRPVRRRCSLSAPHAQAEDSRHESVSADTGANPGLDSKVTTAQSCPRTPANARVVTRRIEVVSKRRIRCRSPTCRSGFAIDKTQMRRRSRRAESFDRSPAAAHSRGSRGSCLPDRLGCRSRCR